MKRLGPGFTGRKWEVRRSQTATSITERSDVLKGEIEGEYVMVWDTFHRGAWGDRDAPPGTIYQGGHVATQGMNVETRYPGRAFPGGIKATNAISYATIPFDSDPVAILEHDGDLIMIAGRYPMKYSDGSWAKDGSGDFGATAVVTDAIVYNNQLIVACGEAVYLWVRAAGGAWTQSSDTYATYFALVEDQLWRSPTADTVSSLVVGADPKVAANWSGTSGAGFTIGDADSGITQLRAQGIRLLVAKQDGLYSGDEHVIFPNVFPELKSFRDSDNGKGMFVRGSDLFYPSVRGLKWRSESGQTDEVGPNRYIVSTANEIRPGWKTTAFADDGETLYVATAPAFAKSEDPDKVFEYLVTPAWADETSNVTDNSMATTFQLDNFATTSKIYIGDTDKFYGILITMKNPNTAASSGMTVQYSKATSFGDFTTDTASNVVVDSTEVGGKSLAKTGTVLWRASPSDWSNANTVNSVASKYWVSLTFAAALSATCDIAEIRILKNPPKCYIWSVRRATLDDYTPNRFVWTPIDSVDAPRITAMGITSLADGNVGRTLVMAGQQVVYHKYLDHFPDTPSLFAESGAQALTLPRNDGGAPFLSKEFISMSVKGKNIGATNTVGLYYRTSDSIAAFTQLGSNVTSSPTTNSWTTEPTGYAIQPQVVFVAPTVSDTPTEINRLECRYRILPTDKNTYIFYPELQDGGIHPRGGIMPSAKIQLDALASAKGIAVPLIDPQRNVKTVHIQDIQAVEALQDAQGMPILVAKVIATEE